MSAYVLVLYEGVDSNLVGTFNFKSFHQNKQPTLKLPTLLFIWRHRLCVFVCVCRNRISCYFLCFTTNTKIFVFFYSLNSIEIECEFIFVCLCWIMFSCGFFIMESNDRAHMIVIHHYCIIALTSTGSFFLHFGRKLS